MSSSRAPSHSGAGNLPPLRRHVPGILARFAPYYVKHFVGQPYRGPRGYAGLRKPLIPPSRRHQIAVYDAVLELMLKGYAELAGHPLRPETGRVSVLLTRVGFAFDDEYEARKARKEPVSFADLIESHRVQERVREWQSFMHTYETYNSMRDFLRSFVASVYQDYASLIDAPGQAAGIEALLDAATLDSGGLLVALAKVVALLHGDDASGELLEQFSRTGVIGKLADDVIDFPLDLDSGRPNILLVMAGADQAEHARAVGLAGSDRPVSTRWWQRNCPGAYHQLATAYQERQARIASRWLRYCGRLMWTPALLGHARRKETRGRI